MKNKIIYLGLLILLVGTSCQKQRVYFPADKDMEKEQIQILRVDSALLAVNPQSPKKDVERLYEQYGDFMPFFVQNIWGYYGEENMDTISMIIQNFVTDTSEFGRAMRIEQIQYNQIDDIEQSVNQSFTRLHYLYPNLSMPKIYFFVSGFSLSNCVIDDQTICIGTDMYLGKNYKTYENLYNVNNYQLNGMQRRAIPIDIMKLYLRYNITYACENNRLIDIMIAEGKLLYLCHQLLPEKNSWEIIGYSKEQWTWCEYYEDKIWKSIMDNTDQISHIRDLYSTNNQLISDYINDGPFTLPVSQDSPSKLGAWIGWRIIESYMQHHEDISLQNLMDEKDAQKILNLSEYRP